MRNVPEHNRAAWNRQSAAGSRWTMPVEPEVIEKAQTGDWEVILTPTRTVPRDWFGDLKGLTVLCLASGGGQQAPVLSAAGARVVSFDISDEQLAKDRLVADRHDLILETIQGDMADLSEFADESFDLIFHPVANVFVRDLTPVWRDCHRVLRPGCDLLAGFMNPAYYLFDHEGLDRGEEPTARFRLPYSDLDPQGPEGPAQPRPDSDEALEFGHSLQSQIGGQLAAGFQLIDLYEDWWDDAITPLNRFMPTTLATRARKTPL
jgi:SAM-dependent methyltransferase